MPYSAMRSIRAIDDTHVWIVGGPPVEVPEPATLCLLMMEFAVLRKRRS